MPIFLVPLHEYNSCHTPAGSPQGGQFCATANPQAHLIRPGEPVDLAQVAQVGDPRGPSYTRRFLFNPTSRETIIGVASGTPGRDQSHAEAHDKVVAAIPTLDPLKRGAHYDRFVVHGHLVADTPGSHVKGSMFEKGPLSIQIDRIATEGGDAMARYHAAAEALHEFLTWAVAHGATKQTRLWMPGGGALQKQFVGTPLGKAFPEVFPKRRRAVRQKKAA